MIRLSSHEIIVFEMKIIKKGQTTPIYSVSQTESLDHI